MSSPNPKTIENRRAYKKQWASADREKNPEKYRRKALRDNLGAEAPDHNAKQLDKQHGYCDLCGGVLPTRTIDQHQDHNHATSRLRGVLCRRCNVGLHYIENLGWKQAAERYLQRWNENHVGL